MIEGIVLVLFTLFLFYEWGNWRFGLGGWRWPCRLLLLGAFMFLNMEGIPANLISMGAIDFGIIADSAVVVMGEPVAHLGGEEGQKSVL